MQYHYLFALAEQDSRINLDPGCFLVNQPLFATMVSAKRSWAELMADTTDYKSLLAETAGRTDAARLEIVNKMAVQMMARQAKLAFDRVFERLNIGPIEAPTQQPATLATE